MQHDNASFWTDIKNCEERLSQNPDSYVFAKLSEVYLKVGLVDDALYTARQGVAKYPGYVAGQRSLALACHAKGLLDESQEALEKVTTCLPEDKDAQKLLGRLLSLNGNNADALKAFRTILEFYPDDVECRLELEALERSTSSLHKETPQDSTAPLARDEATKNQLDVEFGAFEVTSESEEIIEDVEILEMADDDLVEFDEPEYDEPEYDEPEYDAAQPVASVVTSHDPLSTVTLAELYVQQGFTDKALEIYRSILADDPDNSDVQSRIAKLAESESAGFEMSREVRANVDSTAGLVFQGAGSASSLVCAQGEADNSVSVLEGWLDNIRRIKACR